MIKEKYNTILADPPWPFNDSLDRTRHKPYSILSINSICDLPINKISSEKSHLYLWVAHSFLEESFKVIKNWGFKYKIPIVWRKLTKHGKLHFGMGHYFRNSVEFCLFAVKNNTPTNTKNTRNIFDAIKPPIHSSKPKKFYKIIETNSNPPYLEVFARERRIGWDSIGFEIDGMDFREALKNLNNLNYKKIQYEGEMR